MHARNRATAGSTALLPHHRKETHHMTNIITSAAEAGYPFVWHEDEHKVSVGLLALAAGWHVKPGDRPGALTLSQTPDGPEGLDQYIVIAPSGTAAVFRHDPVNNGEEIVELFPPDAPAFDLVKLIMSR